MAKDDGKWYRKGIRSNRPGRKFKNTFLNIDRKRYKGESRESYFGHLFDINQNELINRINNATDIIVDKNQAKDIFLEDILEASNGNQITMKGLEKAMKSMSYTTEMEHNLYNVRSALQRYGLWNEFRTLNRHQKLNAEFLHYEGNDTYTYSDPKAAYVITISFERSPDNVHIVGTPK